MSLLNKASLIQIPSGYKDGTLYSAKPTNGDGDFTFSRGSNLAATRVNSEGLIEKGRENLLLQSNTFDTTWVTSAASVTGGQTGYDGSSDAWLLSKSAGSGRLEQAITKSGVCTLSVYSKAGAVDWVWIRAIDGVDNPNVFFDLQNGLQGITGGTNYIDSSIEQVGATGWYRLKLVFSQGITEIRIYPADDDGDVSGSSGNILIQDAQLEQGLVATDYIETTTTTEQAGILEDMPRLDYSGGATCGSLLLEPQRSNRLTHSEYFDSWEKSHVTTALNNDTPFQNGNSYTLTCDGTTGTFKGIKISWVNAAPNTYSLSVFAKSGTSNTFVVSSRATLTSNDTYASFNLSNGTINSADGGTATIEPYGNGWYRCSFIITNPSTYTDYASMFFGHPHNAADGSSVLVTGAQSEIGSYPTSYIPTYGSSVTRSEDSCSKTGISSLIGQTEGTLFCDFVFNGNPTSVDYAIFIIGAIGSNYVTIGGYNTSLYARVFDSTLQGTINALSMVAGTRYKVAVGYANNDVVMYVNGVNEGVDTSASIPTLSQASFSRPSFEAKTDINQALLFKTRLNNDELAALTTL